MHQSRADTGNQRTLCAVTAVVALFMPSFLWAQAYNPSVMTLTPAQQTALTNESTIAFMGQDDWERANEIVGVFMRGHADILQWEAENLGSMQTRIAEDQKILSFSKALEMGFLQRPDLLVTESTGPAEKMRIDRDAAALYREIYLAWVRATAARAVKNAAQDSFESADIAAELATRMMRVGNWGQSQYLAHQMVHSDAAAALLRARQHAVSAREHLFRLLGIWDDADHWVMPDRLPPIPDQLMPAEGIEQAAMAANISLQQRVVEAERAQRGVTLQASDAWRRAHARAIGELDFFGQSESDTGAFGAPRIKNRDLPAQHSVMAAWAIQNEANQLAVRIRADVREAYHHYQMSYELAIQAKHAHGLAQRLEEETLLQYNGMLKSTWDLLAMTRERISRAAVLIQAERDFWVADAHLRALLAGVNYSSGNDAEVRLVGGESAKGGH